MQLITIVNFKKKERERNVCPGFSDLFLFFFAKLTYKLLNNFAKEFTSNICKKKPSQSFAYIPVSLNLSFNTIQLHYYLQVIYFGILHNSFSIIFK